MELDLAGETGVLTLSRIYRYPVKSCRGERMQQVRVEPWGLHGDRRWALIDPAGEVVTAREVARMVLVAPQVTADGLVLTAPGVEPLWVERPQGSVRLRVRVFEQPVEATFAGTESAEWFTALLGRPLRLVHLDDPTRRPVDPRRGDVDDRVSFADGYPLLLASEESLAALNGWIAEGARAGDGPVPMRRFRPNVVVTGAPGWSEDRWRRLRIGDTTFRAVRACDRCALTLVDPDTAATTKEPLFSLARHRRWGSKTWFAVNLIPDGGGGELAVGDEVEVLKQVEDPTPQR